MPRSGTSGPPTSQPSKLSKVNGGEGPSSNRQCGLGDWFVRLYSCHSEWWWALWPKGKLRTTTAKYDKIGDHAYSPRELGVTYRRDGVPPCGSSGIRSDGNFEPIGYLPGRPGSWRTAWLDGGGLDCAKRGSTG